ncbi:hypothetical protein [Silanimonas sp.]|uniref:hypothetical protein n=1 Tax=Silanimonas sp. TaxID=1929290 RepID=UPI0022C53530|nr:hypothetical protein [Silanimonas sp.]MCZ8062628.1 hypothetical protein [Silanimonas sp.]MCZ8116081.1 hypothetical protein [Silanimonas sp.]
MGTWSAALYGDDDACDLRDTIALVAKLPRSGDQLFDLLRERELGDGDIAPALWVVVADQFERRGIACEAAFSRALQVIESGDDLAWLREAGMDEKDLKKRIAVLAEVEARLRAPRPPKPRPKAGKPPANPLQAGEVYAFPTMRHVAVNSWFPSWEEARFVPDGWGACVVLATGRAFDWLPWAAVESLGVDTDRKPTFDDAVAAPFFAGQGPSRCVPRKLQMQRTGLSLLGRVTLDAAKVDSHLAPTTSPERTVMAGWAISSVVLGWGRARPPRGGLADLLP